MQLCMYRTPASPKPRVGLSFDGVVHDLESGWEIVGSDRQPPRDVLDAIQHWDAVGGTVLKLRDLAADPRWQPVAGAELTLPFPEPVRDAFAIGGNYSKHVEATSKTTGVELTKRKNPVFFMKPTGAFSGPTDPIEYDPSFTERVDYEVELGVVIGRDGRDITREEAMDYVFGYLVVNDVSARDVMLRNKPQIDHFRGKGLDTFFPMGPGVTLRDEIADYRDLRLTLRVNGELKQDEVAGGMTRDIPEIIAELSSSLTLRAGDIIATGTPSGVAQEAEQPVFLMPGDVVETEISGLGRLVNRVQTRTRVA